MNDGPGKQGVLDIGGQDRPAQKPSRRAEDPPPQQVGEDHASQAQIAAGRRAANSVNPKIRKQRGNKPVMENRFVVKVFSIIGGSDPVPTQDHILGSGGMHPLICIPQGPRAQMEEKEYETKRKRMATWKMASLLIISRVLLRKSKIKLSSRT